MRREREAERGLECWLAELDRLQKCRSPTSPAWRALPFPLHPPQHGFSWPSRQPCSWQGTISILIVKNGSSKKSSCSVVQSCLTLHDFMDCSTPGFPVHHQLPELAQTHVHQVGDAIQPSLILCPPLLFPPSVFPSIRIFSNESALPIRWSKYWSFSISPSNEYSGLTSFGIDWLDLLAVQGTLKGLLQYHSSKSPILQCSAFFMIQLSHPYMTTGKTTALTRWTFVGKVMSLLSNMLSRLVIVFLPRK